MLYDRTIVWLKERKCPRLQLDNVTQFVKKSQYIAYCIIPLICIPAPELP